LYKHNIIYVACITYKQIGGSKQYVQSGAIGIFNVLCSLNHAVLRGKKLHWKVIVIVQYMCSMFCMITYGMGCPQMFVSRMNVTRTHTHTLSVDSAKETHTDSMPFHRRMFCHEEMKVSRSCLDLMGEHCSI